MVHTSSDAPSAVRASLRTPFNRLEHADSHRTQVPAQPAPEVDVEVDSEQDSALGEDLDTDTSTLASSIFQHREELGRTYHKYRGGENDYWGPNDEQQNDGLDIGHHMLTLLLDNKLYLAPINEENCRHVLDLGCGTGLWAIDFADAHPDADVTGIDLSPIQPSWVPPNCHFIIDDAEEEWHYPRDHFDFVHIRCLYASIRDWSALYKQMYDRLKPGAWFQQMEMDITFMSDDDTVDENNALSKWSKVFIESGEVMGKTFHVARNAQKWSEEAGFEDVHCQWFKLPVGKWPKDKALKEIGIWNYHYLMQGAEGFALFLLTKVMGWSLEETQVFVAEFRNAVNDRRTHAYYNVSVVWGRKPLGHSTAST